MPARLAPLGTALILAAVVASLSVAEGGFFRWTWPWTALALTAVVAGVPLVRPVGRLKALEVAFVVGLAALAAWQAASAWWSPDPGRALDDALRGTVYVAAGAAFLVLARAGGPRALIAGAVAGVALTLAVGLAEHARADVDPFQGSLLFQPLGYANAVGILAAVAALLALGLLVEPRAPVARAVLVAAVGLSLLALVLTESRGSWLAGALGLGTAAVFQLRGRRGWALHAWLGLVAVLMIAVLVSPLVFGSASLHGLLSDRAYYWPVAWQALDSPLRGLGSGGFAQLWALERPLPVNAVDAHSFVLETLLELGAVGLVVLLATLVLPLAVARRLAGGWAAGATGAYTAFLVHATVDWDWEMPVVTVAGLACAAALLSAPRLARRRRPRP
jgi:O-antigen ligase